MIHNTENNHVAILLATYNGEPFLAELLESIVGQTTDHYCCYIHDDGSTDGTREIIDRYCRLYPERFVVVEGASTGGARNNFMYLLSMVDADYIMFCDQDDVWLPDKIAKTYKVMLDNDDDKPIAIYSDLQVVDSDLKVIDASYYHYSGKQPLNNKVPQLLYCNVAVGCTMMINRRLRDLALDVKNIDNIYMHDWWLALLAAAEGRLLYLPESTILYRQHEGNTVGARKINKGLGERILQYGSIARYIERKRYQFDRSRLFCEELLKVVSPDCAYRKVITDLAGSEGKSIWYKISLYTKIKRIY